MGYFGTTNDRCDWCYTELGYAKRKSRFCSVKCKQAHHRAFKKYLENRVTHSRDRGDLPGKKSNAKKRK